MEAQLSSMEKTIETSELLEIIVETEAEAGVSGMSVAGGGKTGLFVKDVLKDSPAARAMSLREGDQLLSARVYFDNIKYEDALQILKCAEPYKISFCLKRTVPSTDVSRKPGATTFEVRGPKAKVAKLNIQSLKKKKKKAAVAAIAKDRQAASGASWSGDVAGGKLDVAPVDVEFSLPKFSKLRKAKSAGEVAISEPSPDPSPRLSSLETKRRRLKFPRLKVKEAAAARAKGARGWLEVGLPKAAVEAKAAGSLSRFSVPFGKAKRAGAKAEGNFQAPQVELDLPLPSAVPSRGSPKGRVQVAQLGLPKVEASLPKVSRVEIPEGGLQGGLKLPAAEVAAPKVDVDLSFPGLERAVPEMTPKEEGFKIRAPRFGVSAEEEELKAPSVKVPSVEVALGKTEEREEKLKVGVALPPLEVGVPSVELEIPLPKGKAEVELPKARSEVPLLSLPKLGSRAPLEKGEEGRLPQVELSMGRQESPKAKGPRIQLPGFGISLTERKPESRLGAGFPEVKVPSLDIALPQVGSVQLPRPMVEVAAPAGRPRSGEVAEAPGFKFQVPQVSLPKFDLSAKADSLPQLHTHVPRLEGEASERVGIPKVDLSLPAMRLPDMQRPKAPVSRPELDISMEKPRVEVAVPAAHLSCPSVGVPALDIDLPKVGLELDLPKAEREPAASEQLSGTHEVKLRVPSPKAVSRDLEVEISVPTCQGGLPEAEPRERVLGGPDVSGMVAKIPKVDLSLGMEEAAESSQAMKGQPRPKAGLEVEGAKVKLPSVEIPPVKIPDMTLEGGKALEAEASIKAPRFTLPKFSLPGAKAWKASPEASAPEAEGGMKAKLKGPKFGISFPKSKGDVEGAAPKGRPAAALEAHGGLEILAVDVTLPAVDVDLGLPAWPSEEPSGPPLPEAGVELPDIKLKVPKFSLPKFRGKGKEGDLAFEIQEGRLRGSREALAGDLGTKGPEKEAKASKFKMPSFGLMRSRDTAGMEAEAKKAPGSPKEKPKGGPFSKMPRLKLSSPKVEADRGKLAHLQAPPELEVKVPQVELPRIGGRDEVGLAMGAESPTLKVKVPSLEISMPSSRGEGEKPVVDVSESDLRGYEGELKIPRVPSVGISTPKLELEVSLPTAGAEEPTLPAEARIKLPQVELPRFGRAEEGGAEVQLLGGRRLSFGEEGAVDASLLGTKIRLPRVDLSLPKGRLSDTELPLTTEGGDVVPEGSEAKFRMPSVGLPKFSAPRVKAPEVELDVSSEAGKGIRTKAGGPVIRLAKFGGSTSDREAEAEVDLPRVPQLELKAPKLRASAEALSPEAKEAFRIKMPSVPLGFGLAKGEAEARGSPEEGKFKIKLPSLGLSKAGADTQPLCPPSEGADYSFKMPQIALPDVGFSVEQEGKSEAAQREAGKLPDLDVEVGGFEARLKVPQIKVPAVELVGPQGDGGGEAEGEGAAFHVPGLELSAPSLKAHAEYQVEGAELRGGQGREVPEAEAGKRYKVKIPKFGLSLPKGGAEGGEGGPPGHEGEAKVKRPTFGLGRAKGRGAEGLLEREGEEADGSGKGGGAKLKLKPPTFGLSLSPKAKGGGAEVNGELEDGSPLKVKVPKLGFSKGQGGAQVNGEQAAGASLPNGAKLGKIRLPQVELSSPPKMAGADLELNLELVGVEEAKDEDPGAGRGALAALKAAKFKSPKISFSGFRKRPGEGAAGPVVSSAARVEMSSLEGAEMGAKGERSPKSRFPRVALSPKAQGGLEGGSEHGEGGLRIKLPSVGFSGEQEGQVLEGRAAGARGEAGEATA